MIDQEGDDKDNVVDEASSGEFVNGSLRFPLQKPIKHGKDSIVELRLREPSGRDMIAIGNPVLYDPISTPPRIVPDAEKMARMIAQLASIPPSCVEQISPKEQTQLGWILAPFFVPI